MDIFRTTEERVRVIELLDRMLADAQETERLLRQMGAPRPRLQYQADISQYLTQQKSLVSQDWRLADESAGKAGAGPS